MDGCRRMCFDSISSVKRVFVAEHVRECVLAFCLRISPREAVAALTGRIAGDRVEVTDAVFVRNLARSCSYFVTSTWRIKAAANIGAGTLLGIFHSHNKDLTLSREDVAAMKRWPGLWLIGIPDGKDLKLLAFLALQPMGMEGADDAAGLRCMPIVTIPEGKASCSTA